MPHICIVAIPAVLAVLLMIVGGLIRKKESTIQALDKPWRPYSLTPGLAMELADSAGFVSRLLGNAGSESGEKNRKAVAAMQYLDFVFIPLYTAFFITVAVIRGGCPLLVGIVIVLALLTAACDILEDIHILRLLGPKSGSSVRPYGRWKWLFYFATVAAEGVLMVVQPHDTVRALAGAAFGVFLILLGLGGVRSSLKISFVGIGSAAAFSMLGLVGLAFGPLAALSPVPWREVAEYAILLRVPLLVALLLLALPCIAFRTGAKSLLQGLFDLTPWSLLTVTLTAYTVAGTACMTAYLVLAHAHERFPELIPISWLPLSLRCWLLIMSGLSAPVIGSALVFSVKQKRGTGSSILAVLAGATIALALGSTIILWGSQIGQAALPWLQAKGFEQFLQNTGVFQGYVASEKTSGTFDPLIDHIRASVAFGVSLLLYAIVGLYGWWCLGKRRTVPALSAALMLMMVLGWMLSGVAFFFDAWHVPILLIVAAAGTLTTYSTRSDHYYDLRNRVPGVAPTPAEALAATKAPRAIVVAANGGGIQAGAWAAQVLFGLCNAIPDNKFQSSLRLISSVSGGSLGSACFVHWLANPNDAQSPEIAAAESSLDEVAWGLGWTDLLRSLFPWYLGGMIGRGRALERAWRSNSSVNFAGMQQMDAPLSEWNPRVAAGDLPAVVMNATITETGQRLLLATTDMRKTPGSARLDGTTLHIYEDQNGDVVKKDVGVTTAARLSASFPYVTPAARAKEPGPQPHVVDGGYYDNYGMATLVEWLDSALQAPGNRFDKVLVIEIHGSPVPLDPNDLYKTERGWFYQAIAPLITLDKVRGAGQIAHKEIELEFLRQKWLEKKVHIDRVLFEFPDADVPLSWHLTPGQIQKIRDAWATCPEIAKARQQVQAFV